LFTRQPVANPTQHEVVAHAPWPFQILLVDVECDFYDSASTTILDRPTSVHVPPNVPAEFIATLRQFSSDATALVTYLAITRPFLQAELNVKAHEGGELTSGLVDYAATHDFPPQDFVRRFSLPTRKSKVKTQVRLANGQLVTSSTVCDITFDLARQEF
jgi:hypothetical protein